MSPPDLPDFIAPVAGIATTVVAGPVAGYAVYSGLSSMDAAAEGKRIAQAERRTQQQLALEYRDYRLGEIPIIQAGYDAQIHALNQQAHLMKQAAHQAKVIAGQNADLLEQEGQETVRRLKKQHKATEGSTRARLAASGIVSTTGSPKKFQKELKSENVAERKWVEKSFQSQADIVREGGALNAKALSAQALGIGAGVAQLEAESALAYAQAMYDIDARLTAAGLPPMAGRPGAPNIQLPGGFGNLTENVGSFPALGTPAGTGATGGSAGAPIGGVGFGTAGPSTGGGFVSQR